MKKLKLKILGMHCGNCAMSLEKKIKTLVGVHNANANFALASLTVEFNVPTTEKDIHMAVRDVGFSVMESEAEKNSKETKEFYLLVLGIVATIPLFLSMTEEMFGVRTPLPDFLTTHSTHWFLASIVQFICGYRFYIDSYNAVKNKMLDMSVLIFLGTNATYFLSIYNMLVLHKMPYFESSAMIITLVLLGKYLEGVSKTKAGQALEDLVAGTPKQATILINGEPKEVAVETIQSGDIVFIRPGEKLAVDGVVLDGFSEIDESLLTGESVPSTKKIGDKVFASTQNTYGTLTYTASSAGAESVFANIIKVLQEAQGKKAPIQRLVDKIASVFVPIVITIAIITFAAWYFIMPTDGINQAIINAVSVLVISCPCALGLATPTSILVATGRGAELGILYKGGEELEKTSHIDTVVLDKTGTITVGKPKVTSFKIWDDTLTEEIFFQKVAMVEKFSEHPLAKAIIDMVDSKNIANPNVKDFAIVPGKGLQAILDEQEILVGTENLLRENAIELTNENLTWTTEKQIAGNTVIYVAIDKKLSGSCAIADVIKENADLMVKELESIGMEVWMLTGDNQQTAEKIAKEVGIKNIKAQVLPLEKADFVQYLQNQGKKVAMIGDGVNDAPALAQANLGVSMFSGSDVTVETGDITIMNNSPRALVDTFKLGRAGYTNIKQNLFWALIYNSLSIPLATLGYLSPALAGLCMALSSISVVMNALRLRNFK